MTMEARGAQEAIEAVDFPAASIDRVICNSGLAYLQDTPAALRRYRGWLRPGGRRAPCLARAPLSIGRRLHRVCLQHSGPGSLGRLERVAHVCACMEQARIGQAVGMTLACRLCEAAMFGVLLLRLWDLRSHCAVVSK